MKSKATFKLALMVITALTVVACSSNKFSTRTENTAVPEQYRGTPDSLNSADVLWRTFFKDEYLNALIDTALQNNQELNIMLQEIAIAKNEVLSRKGDYLPFLDLGGGAGVDKAARYTTLGASEATTDIAPGVKSPDPVPNYVLGAYASWEVDIWRKLRNARDAAAMRYLASVEGKNFMVTHLISEIANSYYELLALDNQLALVRRNIEIQSNALEIMKLQKQSAKVTELAVRRFEAQVLHTQSLQYAIQQRIIETEGRINFLVGRFPRPVRRTTVPIIQIPVDSVLSGIPSQLLENRPDVRQAEQQLAAAKLDVKVAKAYFYPSLNISAALGLQAFDPAFVFKAPESMLYGLAGDLAAPLINRRAIRAAYYSANARQVQAVYNYERTILSSYIEVYNQLANIDNLRKAYQLREQQVEALTASIEISNGLFLSARADYMEVLLTQRDALESRFELIETRKQQLNAMVNIYRALGGGWK